MTENCNNTYDLTAEAVPYALVKCRLALEEAAVGQVCRFLVKGEESVRSISVCLPYDGDEILSIEHMQDGVTEIVVRKRRE